MRFNPQSWRDYADLVLKIVSVMAILVGGYWGYYQFFITDFDVDNVQMSISTEVIKYNNAQRLLVVHAKPRNIGKTSVTPGKGGLVITAKEVPKSLDVGIVNFESISDLYKFDIMKRYPDGYMLEPGVEYDELLTIVVPAETIYSMAAKMDLTEDYEVDAAAIVKVD